MSEKFTEGQVLQGKVTGVQPYGAFVALDDQVQGLVHISEVTHGFVKDINDHIKVGDEVNVKILSIDEAKNKYSLSIRATEEAPKQKAPRSNKPKQTYAPQQEEQGFNTLKDKLEEWLKQSGQNK
ncbi:general stress protein 13 [Halolactibacillus alkaliphilus]|uniref:General stress protein 13 n=1 Tax=Halolactibacillus alkaliphilus TaxID=442899 RepID=A0A511X3Z7_9BACI|nr:S1 domain-containing post-transcriptional regulator GSP13 [Halolactibacillus alkaliphilus]GEN57676.1 general stress protein 13 [Halolactibacillus alkaliphilus]GGN74654.1 general stress protein 13 [Halolactibacillus alkaliphilus]SFP02858.1 general stress protein 13 [Halolactibacillus alkaliphilus]